MCCKEVRGEIVKLRIMQKVLLTPCQLLWGSSRNYHEDSREWESGRSLGLAKQSGVLSLGVPWMGIGRLLRMAHSTGDTQPVVVAQSLEG